MKFTNDRSVVLATEDLGESQAITPEGYLLCIGVPIARTGSQQYLNSELEPECEGGTDGVIHVERLEADVFHPDTIASFEGKPVTDDHPSIMLRPSNVTAHFVGTTLNVRRGEGEQRDFLIADLLIMDQNTIAAVRAGKRQVSCGYGSDYETITPGRARQFNIVGNHVALVARGRCGPSCAIGDEDMVAKKESFFDRMKKFMDEYSEGEEGKQTVKDLSSVSGQESASHVGGDTHIHVYGTGDPKANQLAGAADAEADEEDKDDKKDNKDAKTKSLDERMSEVEKNVGEIKDCMDALMKGAKDAEKEEDKDDKEAKDAKADEEGKEEAEGEAKDAEKEEDKEDKKDDTKDKKGTKDSLPLKAEYIALKSDIEVLVPGMKTPTFDSAVAQKQTMDSMCLMRRRALAAHAASDDGKEAVAILTGGKAFDMKTMTCDSVEVYFNAAVGMAKDQINAAPGGLKKAKATQDRQTPQSIHDVNKQASEFWKKNTGIRSH